ncbi:MAG: hypothetical protein ABIQ87_05110 [Rubrivivax sp.]
MHLINSWARACLGVVVALVLAIPSWAQSPNANGRDDGEYQILQAFYGTARAHIDVTPRLRELARADRIFALRNETFGADPDPGQPKMLRVIARGRDGQVRTLDVAEGGVLNGAQFTGWAGGNFGDHNFRGGWQGGGGMVGATSPNNVPGNNAADQGDYQILQARYGTSRANLDVTARLRELAKADRSIRLGNATFDNDPDPGQIKTLRIFARSRDGQTHTFDYAENGVVDGSQFSGWSGGGFGDPAYRAAWPGSQGPDAGRRDARGRDEGDYRVLQALYGTARRNVDVTDRLRDLARSDDEMRVSRRSFGIDPDPGKKKSLRIFARGRDDNIRMFEFAQGQVVDGSDFRAWRGGAWGQRGTFVANWNGEVAFAASGTTAAPATLRIISATYGSGSRKRDVTGLLRKRVYNDRLEAFVDGDLLGADPAPGAKKTLWVTYSIDGRTQQARVDERGQLSIP